MANISTDVYIRKEIERQDAETLELLMMTAFNLTKKKGCNEGGQRIELNEI